ncbi:glycosyltransferase family 25 protein [Pseudomonas sp. CCNWLW56]|jgi:glycosyl transferase family 25|nr:MULTISPECIES: glycosyltransferase family 25 protein [Pseudomonas]MDT8906967.1 glycosyltransferase family 25 protein [Pseudomonas prosekii]NHN69737.1 hypothetical protein [Pseudomonas fluorescens]SFW97691.1 Glycosyltransferase family 25 (LPS biosynthesis protein) [Pseudomonas sp. NFACC36]SIR87151.1 glycosyl transferase, family 25 [Pseudomonas sp. 7SR1]
MKTKDLSRLSVDGVLCISLKDRKDRRLLLLETMKRSGLDIEFVLVDPDRENPARGCFNSHLKCAEIALQRNYSNVLILEDDALQYFFSKQTVRNINRFISTEKFFHSPSRLHDGENMAHLEFFHRSRPGNRTARLYTQQTRLFGVCKA